MSSGCWREDRYLLPLCPLAEGPTVRIQYPRGRQKDGHSCGPVCVTKILKLYKRPVPTEWPSTSALDGTHPYAMVPVFRGAGLHVLAGSCPADVLATHVRHQRPAVALVTYRGEGHYVCVSGWERGRVYSDCPMRGETSEPIKTFLESWHTSDGPDLAYRQWAALVWE